MHDKLPKEIVYRKKKGFPAPVARWINGPLRGMIDEMLDESVIAQDGIFNSLYVKKILRDHRLKIRDNRKQIWTLFVFQLWKKYWL
jgi:asparagine synthase (glutamine-hydrolysing)